jgi:M-phase inducer tyrosine phosphatase
MFVYYPLTRFTDESGLPTLPGCANLPRIVAGTLHKLLCGLYDRFFASLYVIDCRYGYEFIGGHIRGALHVESPEAVRDTFFPDVEKRCVIVFHCEFSSVRGPALAEVLRQLDRCINVTRPGVVFYPNVFVLDGGYSEFFARYPRDCTGGYRLMRNSRYVESGELARAKCRWDASMKEYQSWKQRPLEAMHEKWLQEASGKR